MRLSITTITFLSMLLGLRTVVARNAAASILSEALATLTVSYITNFASTTTTSTATSAPPPTVASPKAVAICDCVFEGTNQEGGGGGGGAYQTNIDNCFFNSYIADYNEHELTDANDNVGDTYSVQQAARSRWRLGIRCESRGLRWLSQHMSRQRATILGSTWGVAA